MEKQEDIGRARKNFLAHLRFTKGYSEATCYTYNSDLGIWGRWLEAGNDWRRLTHVDVEQFAGWQMRERGVQAHIVSRRASCLSSFYKWAMKNGLVQTDPVYLADKPKRPHRIPVWLEKEVVTLRQPNISGKCARPDGDSLDSFHQPPESGKESTMKCVINNQVVLSRAPEGPLALYISSFAKSVSVQGLIQRRLPILSATLAMSTSRIRSGI